MKYLIPVNSSKAALAPIEHLMAAARQGMPVEAVLLNVQRPFNQRVSRFAHKADRDALHAERSRAIMASAIEMLSRAGIPFRAMTDVGAPAECIAAVAETQQVDEILMGGSSRPRWTSWLLASTPREVAAHTGVPVALVGGEARAANPYLLLAGVASAAGIAALLLTAD